MGKRWAGTVLVAVLGFVGAGCSAGTSVEATGSTGSVTASTPSIPETLPPDTPPSTAEPAATTETPPTDCERAPVTTHPGQPSDELGPCLPPGADPTSGSRNDEQTDVSRPMSTGVMREGEATWPASGPMSDEGRSLFVDVAQRFDTALLLPPAGRWADPATVTITFTTYPPATEYAEAGTVARHELVGSPILSVSGAPERGDPCAADRGLPSTRTTIRGVAGCTSDNGTIAFATWREAGFQWHVESGSLGVDDLLAELAAWQVVTVDDV
jgi:hypothetical protein